MDEPFEVIELLPDRGTEDPRCRIQPEDLDESADGLRLESTRCDREVDEVRVEPVPEQRDAFGFRLLTQGRQRLDEILDGN